MRQAGRSLPEYRAIRAEHEMLEMCRDPEIATEVTLQPVRRLGVDAAVLFSDIVIQLQGMGVDLAIEPGIGPVIKNPITSMADVAALEPLEPERDVPFVIETIENLVGELDVPLIGFAGAPFTLASYLIEGGPSKDHAKTKAFMHSQPATFRSLLTRLRTSGAIYLAAQAAAGASALQVFDSWAGALAPADYEAHVLEHMSALFHDLAATGVPRIHFGVVTGELLELMNSAGPDVMGIDWRVPLDKARARLPGVPLQGNLDPALLLAPWDVTERAAADVLRRGGGRGHIFNLGHGVLPDTDPGQLRRLVDFVQAWPSDGDS